jgi:isocitrate/isopropylmalate dehydrogenase
MHCVTLIPGEGIGPEVAGAARSIVEAAGAYRGGPPNLNVALRKTLIRNLGGTASTTEFTHAVVRALKARALPRPIPAASR